MVKMGWRRLCISFDRRKIKRKKNLKAEYINDARIIEILNPLHPNIRADILHIVLYTFPEMLKKGNCSTIRSFFCW